MKEEIRGEGKGLWEAVPMARSQHYLSTTGNCRAGIENLLPADHAAPSRHRLLSFPQKKRFPGGAVRPSCFMMSLLLRVSRSQAGLASAFDIIHRKALGLQRIRLMRRRIWIGMLELWGNLKYILDSFFFSQLWLHLYVGWISWRYHERQGLKPPSAKSQRLLSWREGKRQKKKKKGKKENNKETKTPPSLDFVCNPCVLAKFSRAPTLGGLCSPAPAHPPGTISEKQRTGSSFIPNSATQKCLQDPQPVLCFTPAI